MNDRDLDALIGRLPEFAPPPEFDEAILKAVRSTPQDVELADDIQPANTTRFFLRAILPVASLAAAAAVGLMVWPSATYTPNPDDWTERGVQGLGPEIQLSMSVIEPGESPGRYARGKAYEAGSILMFRANSEVPGALMLVRVDAQGASVIHTESFDTAGTADLRSETGRYGYQLEPGQREAIFALLHASSPIDEGELQDALRVQPEVAAVCAAAAALGAQCAAERVEAVQ